MSNPLIKLIALGVAAIMIAGGVILNMKPDLVRIHEDIAQDYEQVEHIDATTFTNMPANDVVIFDVREPEEYAVSHLPGAILLDPNLSEEEFQARYSEALEGKTAIFYCSVGRRSSNIAQRVAGTVEAKTSHAPVNLIGGLFQWSNDERSLITADGETTNAIHPYNAHWGRLIENQDAVQYTPVPLTSIPQGDDND